MDKKQMITVGIVLILFTFAIFNISFIGQSLSDILTLMSPLIIGSIIAYAINIPMTFFENHVFCFLNKFKNGRSLSRRLSFLFVLVIIVGIVAVLVTILIPQVVQIVNLATTKLPMALKNLENYLSSKGLHLSSTIFNTLGIDTSSPQKIQSLLGSFGEMLLHGVVKSSTVISTIFSSVLGIFFTAMFVFYMLMSKEKIQHLFKKILYANVAEPKCDKLIALFSQAHKVFSSFIAGQCLEALILGTMVLVSMLIFGMPYSVLISAIVAVFALLPIIGAWIAAIAGFLLILTVDIKLAGLFILLFLVLQTIEGNAIYPRVMNKAVGLPPLWVLVAVVVGQSFFGVFGTLFLIPLTSIVYQLLEEHSNKKVASKKISPEKLI